MTDYSVLIDALQSLAYFCAGAFLAFLAAIGLLATSFYTDESDVKTVLRVLAAVSLLGLLALILFGTIHCAPPIVKALIK